MSKFDKVEDNEPYVPPTLAPADPDAEVLAERTRQVDTASIDPDTLVDLYHPETKGEFTTTERAFVEVRELNGWKRA